MDEDTRLLLKRYAGDALGILEHSIKMDEKGELAFYRVVAVQLRLLLCDTTFRHNRHEDISIIPLLFPDLRITLPDWPDGINLQTWLDSPSGLTGSISVRQMIRRVCDIDGGAHVEIKPLAGLPESRDVRQWIIDIGKELLPVLTGVLED